MKYDSLADIYNAAIGDKIIINRNITVVTDIYAEAIINSKWVSVDEHVIDHTYVIELLDSDSIKNKDIVDHIVLSNFHGIDEDGKLTLKLPDHINKASLRSATYGRCKNHTIKFFENYVIVTKKVDSFNKNILNEQFDIGDVKTVNKSNCKNVTSTISHLYKLAKEMGIVISIKNNPRTLVITHRGIVDTTTHTESFTTTLNNWLKELPYDMTVDIPTRFTDIKTSAYINTVLNKSKYTCKVYAGRVTKLSAAIKKKNGVIQVIVNERVIKQINKPSLTNLNSRDRKLIDLALKPYGKTYQEIR